MTLGHTYAAHIIATTFIWVYHQKLLRKHTTDKPQTTLFRAPTITRSIKWTLLSMPSLHSRHVSPCAGLTCPPPLPRNAANYVSESVQGAGSQASKEAHKRKHTLVNLLNSSVASRQLMDRSRGCKGQQCIPEYSCHCCQGHGW